jgi:hypothetical protein
MRPTDRDYCVSTIAVLQEHRRQALSILDDMAMRLDELDETLLYAYAQKEDEEAEEAADNAWESGYAYCKHITDKIAKRESPSPKLCMCDECWDVDEPEDRGESKKEYFDWIDDVLRKTRRAPQDYRMD